MGTSLLQDLDVEDINVEIIIIGGWLWVISCTDSMTDVTLTRMFLLLLLTAELVHEMIQLELRINQNRRRSLIVLLGHADLVVIAEDAAFRRDLGLELAP